MPSREGVDDVVQETALECWKKFADFAPASPEHATDQFIRWACVIARYKALSWQRDRGRDRLVFRKDVIKLLAKSALENVADYDREQNAVECCLQKLEDDQRRLVLSVHQPGESIARIAEATGTNARRLYHQVNSLRKQLLECVRLRLRTEVDHR
jgi:RNA polymerase sigma-70 factor (ECF subfamily)